MLRSQRCGRPRPLAGTSTAPARSHARPPALHALRCCREGEACSQWDILINATVPADASSKKRFFEGLIFSSWGMLGLTA